MRAGIIGLPATGKTTVFNLLTHAHAEVHRFTGVEAAPNVGATIVPDARLDFLSQLYHPKKTTHATVEFVDVAGLVPGTAKGKGFGPQFLDALRGVDVLVHVVRAFENAAVPHPEGSVNPARDAESVELELMLADLASVEKRLQRLDEDARKGRNFDKKAWQREHHVLTRLRDHLSEERPLRTAALSHEEEVLLRGFTFLSQKPLLIVANVGEDTIGQTLPEALTTFADSRHIPLSSVSAQIEYEISLMDAPDAEEFSTALGIEEPASDRLLRSVYKALNAITFYTMGQEECRAWTVPRGSTALTAAGKVHSDMARGFIRAEVVAFDHLRADGSWHTCKEKGHLKVEGKEYVVQDGDCILVRFNV